MQQEAPMENIQTLIWLVLWCCLMLWYSCYLTVTQEISESYTHISNNIPRICNMNILYILHVSIQIRKEFSVLTCLEIQQSPIAIGQQKNPQIIFNNSITTSQNELQFHFLCKTCGNSYEGLSYNNNNIKC